jgi:hypothetical protein
MHPKREIRRVLLSVFCVLLVVTPASRAALPLPAQLSDAEFWRLVSTSSEQGGGFISENLVSNELGYPYIIPSLMERVPAGGAYMGVGPEQNFTYIAAIHPSIAFVVDIRRQNMIEHLLYKAVFELSANRQEFLSRLFARKVETPVNSNVPPAELFTAFAGVPKDEEFYRTTLQAIKDLLVVKHGFELSDEDKSTLEHVYEEFSKNGTELRYTVQVLPSANRVITFLSVDEIRMLPVPPGGPVPATSPNLSNAAISLALSTQFPSYADVITTTDPAGRNWSYLASEENYRSVRELQQRNLIVPLVGDFAGPKAIRAVGQYLKDHDASVSTFYVSNVEQYLTPVTKLQSFYANVATLPLNSSSTFIRSAQIAGPQPGLAQSSLSPIQLTLDAVLEGRAQSWSDILRLTNSK